MLMVSFSSIQPAQAINNQQINASVQVLCPDGDSNWFSGSGTMIDSSGIVMTNRHVVTDSNGYIINSCYVGVTKSISVAPSFDYVAEVKYWATDADMDVAFLYIDNQANELFSAIDVFAYDTNNLNLGDSLEVVGYPSIGNSTLTYVNGVVSGFSGNYIKSTAPIDQGNSGGSAYNSQGYFVGIPSAVQLGVANSISYILNINNVKDWLIQTFGSDYQADLYGASATSNINENIIEQQSDITSPNTDAVYGWVYTDSSMNTALTFEQTESDSNPYFIWDGFTDDSGIAGYYVYFGFDFNARPIEEGMLVTSNKYYGKADKGDGEYYLFPGGGMEFGETPEEAAKREMVEEIGTEIEIVSLIPKIYTEVRHNWQGVFICFLCKLKSEISQIVLNDEASEYNWFGVEQISKLKLMPKTFEMVLEAEKVKV